MYEGFWYESLELAQKIRKRIDGLRCENNENANPTESEYWKAIWDIATSPAPKDSLKHVAWDITNYVMPVINETDVQDAWYCCRLKSIGGNIDISIIAMLRF